MGSSSWSWIIQFLSVVQILGNVYGAREAFPMESLRAVSTCSPSSEGIPVIHRHGPCSPLAQYDSHQLFVKDQARVDFIQNPKSMGDATTSLPLGSQEYFATVQIGTPKHNFSLIIDTGSDLTWLQSCSADCYAQKEPMYDPDASSTHVAVPGEPYTITYGDNSSSKGVECRDTLTLPHSGTVLNFTFGVGQETSGDFGLAAGMLGLSRGDISLVSQTRSTFRQTFCYCLTASKRTTGYLLFGERAQSKCHSPTFTPLLTHRRNSDYYFVNLLGITIGTKRLAVSSNSNSPTTLLDSGTVITRLPPHVYSALSAEFKSLMSPYPLATPNQTLLDTCYDLTAYQYPSIPTMVMHFQNADVDLDPSGVVSPESDLRPNVVCLAFATNKNSSNNFIIIGNTQQRTLGVLYDVPDMKVGFKPKAC